MAYSSKYVRGQIAAQGAGKLSINFEVKLRQCTLNSVNVSKHKPETQEPRDALSSGEAVPIVNDSGEAAAVDSSTE